MTKKHFPEATMDGNKLYFHKRSAADVTISDEWGGDFFTFTPGFGDFKDIYDLDEYLERYVKDRELKWADIDIEWQRHCIYEINPETLELGEFVEGSGIEGQCLEWNGETFEEREEEEDDDE